MEPGVTMRPNHCVVYSLSSSRQVAPASSPPRLFSYPAYDSSMFGGAEPHYAAFFGKNVKTTRAADNFGCSPTMMSAHATPSMATAAPLADDVT